MSSSFQTTATFYLSKLRGAALGIATIATLIGAPALAADMPVKAPVTYDWTGFYLGGEFGYGWATNQNTELNTTGTNFPAVYTFNPVNMNGVLGGFYGGYNYQINRFLVGIDADYTFAKLTGTGIDVSPITGNIFRYPTTMNWISTTTGRLGYVNNNWLWFAKGGWAWAEFDQSSVQSTPGLVLTGASLSPATSARDGWTVGGGAEWRLSGHWLAKFEYDYVRFDRTSFSTMSINPTGIPALSTISPASSLNMLKAGAAYRF